MKERTAWPSILAVALLLRWVEPAPCAGQSPAPANPTAPAPRAAAPASALPSAVSSDIERFVKRSGRDLPQPPALPDFNAGESQGVRDLPPLPLLPAPTARTLASRAAAATSPSPLAATPKIKAAPFGPADLRFPINLATALRLSDARPLIVAAAQAKVWIAEAALTKAKILWIPDLIVGFDYVRHDGGGPDFNKGIMTAVSTNFFYGGAGLNEFIGLTDAIYQPLVARQVLNSRQWDIQSAKNDALLETADAYFMVHRYRGIYASTLYTVERGHDLVEQIATLSRDLTMAFEIDRARNLLADLEQEAVSARERWRVQSARLTKVLRLDPRAVVEPLEQDHLQITLIDPGQGLDELMPIALNNRPELASRRALVQAAETRVRQEKARPLIPSLLLNGYQTPAGMLLQAGIFGIGPNSSLNQWSGRDDVSVQLVWQLENMGFGNLARIKNQRGQESRAIIELRKLQDTVVEDVNQVHARLESAAARVTQAERSLRTGIITYNGTVEGLKQTSRFGDVLELITRPQEAVSALQHLKMAFDEYFTTVAEYNRVQFELFHALGYPAREIAELRPPGQVLPVTTVRPSYLPPVGNGPPPATRSAPTPMMNDFSGWVLVTEVITRSPQKPRAAFMAICRERAAYHVAMRKKWSRAAWFPWTLVDPGPVMPPVDGDEAVSQSY